MAVLELNVDPSGAETGVRQFEQAMARAKAAAGGTERANDNLSDSYTQLKSRISPAFRASVEFGRGQATVNAALKAGTINAKQAKLATRELELEYKRATASAGGFATKIRSIGASAAILGTVITGVVAKSIGSFREFDAALSEVTTLITGTAEETEALSESAKDLSERFGTSATQQVQAFYQAISAGVGDVADASAFLETANKLAVGGVTDITTAVDVLSGAVNAYEETGLTAARASDILFTGVKAGKTTISELGANLGKIIPIAAKTGVSLEEVVSGVAALTAQSVPTSEAITGVRQVIQGIIKPTSEAKDIAKQLGIEFNAAALESKGLEGILKDVARATGGSTTQITKLFGSVEAVSAVLGLSSNEGKKFTGTLKEMENAAGATDVAFKKIDESLSQRLVVELVKFANIGIEIGNVLLTGIVPALEAVTSNLEATAAAALGVGAVLALTFAPATGSILVLSGAIALVVQNWDTLKQAALSALEFISAATGITADNVRSSWDSVFKFMDSVFKFIIGDFKTFEKDFKTGLRVIGLVADNVFKSMAADWREFEKAVKNGLIAIGLQEKETVNDFKTDFDIGLRFIRGNLDSTVQTMSVIWNNLGDVVAFTFNRVNRTVASAIRGMVNASIDGINSVIVSLNTLAKFLGADKALEFFGIETLVPTIGKLDLTEFEKKLDEDAAKLGLNFGANLIKATAAGSLAATVPAAKAISDGLQKAISANTPNQGFAPEGSGGGFSLPTLEGAANDNGLPSVTRPSKDLEDGQKTGNRFLDDINTNTARTIDELRALGDSRSQSDDNLLNALIQQQKEDAAETRSLLQQFQGSQSNTGSNLPGASNGESGFTASVARGLLHTFTGPAETQNTITTLENNLVVARNDVTIEKSKPRTTEGDILIERLEAGVRTLEAQIAEQQNKIIQNQQNTPRVIGAQPVQFLGSFASGGSGTIGGSGGADSQLFAGFGTPGETFAFGDDAERGTRNTDNSTRQTVKNVTVEATFNVEGDINDRVTQDNLSDILREFAEDLNRGDEELRGTG